MNTAGIVAAILASAVVVFGALWRLTRALWNIAQIFRDLRVTTAESKLATEKNTTAIVALSDKMDGRVTTLETDVAELKRRLT